MTVSIIIAVKTWRKNLDECVNKCLELNYADFEIIVLPDEPLDKNFNHPKVRVIPTGPENAAVKRDRGIEYAEGEIIAFIDDDAFPAPDWLEHAIKNFSDPRVAAVGGPAVTPPEDGLREKASGIIYSSLLVSGHVAYRYTTFGRKIEIDDYPSCNLLVRKSVMQKIGGFKSDFWPGEDTIVCLEITKKLGEKIIYEPQALVYHHRRKVFLPHLRQLASYALHRGYFVKKFPETSRRIAYFIPALFLLGVVSGGFLSFFREVTRILYVLTAGLYIFLVFIFSIFGIIREQGISGHTFAQRMSLFFMVFFGIILSHLTYGFYFLRGLWSRKLRDDKT